MRDVNDEVIKTWQEERSECWRTLMVPGSKLGNSRPETFGGISAVNENPTLLPHSANQRIGDVKSIARISRRATKIGLAL